MRAGEAAISLRGAVKRYGEIVAVNGLDLEVAPSICFGLLGPNGAGKSTTMRMLTAQTLADEGEQRFGYALMPHAGTWHEGGVREEAEDLNQPLLVAAARGLAPTSLAPLGCEGVVAGLGALKAAEDGDGLILRLYEPAGARGPLALKLPAGWREAGALDLLERPSAPKAEGALSPFEVRSWRLRRG